MFGTCRATGTIFPVGVPAEVPEIGTSVPVWTTIFAGSRNMSVFWLFFRLLSVFPVLFVFFGTDTTTCIFTYDIDFWYQYWHRYQKYRSKMLVSGTENYGTEKQLVLVPEVRLGGTVVGNTERWYGSQYFVPSRTVGGTKHHQTRGVTFNKYRMTDTYF